LAGASPEGETNSENAECANPAAHA
jgi:hypothetical protein